MAHMRRLTFLERHIIEWCVAKNKSHRQIGYILGRDHRVIGRELTRNTPAGRPYTAKLALRLTAQREARRCRKKLQKDVPLRDFVVQRLKQEFSPEQIAGLLQYEAPEELQGKTLCPETIYQYVYTGEDEDPTLYTHLRRHKKKRQSRGVRTTQKVQILERISIHDRPLVIARKERFGDFECDLVEGPRTDKEALSVQYERKSQAVKLYRVQDKTAQETYDKLVYTQALFPEGFMKSVTFDNGSETALHHMLRYEHGVDTYHCDPYASWQKGGVENMNGLIRQYIPKGTPISNYTDRQLKEIEDKLNNRPRKSHNFKTPNQVLALAGVGH